MILLSLLSFTCIALWFCTQHGLWFYIRTFCTFMLILYRVSDSVKYSVGSSYQSCLIIILLLFVCLQYIITSIDTYYNDFHQALTAPAYFYYGIYNIPILHHTGTGYHRSGFNCEYISINCKLRVFLHFA